MPPFRCAEAVNDTQCGNTAAEKEEVQVMYGVRGLQRRAALSEADRGDAKTRNTKVRPVCRSDVACGERGSIHQTSARRAMPRMTGERSIEDQEAGGPRDVDRPLRRETGRAKMSERRTELEEAEVHHADA